MSAVIPAWSMTVLGAHQRENGDIVLAVRHVEGGNPVEKTILIPAQDVDTIQAAADSALALTTWIKEHFPKPPAWASAAVGITIDL